MMACYLSKGEKYLSRYTLKNFRWNDVICKIYLKIQKIKRKKENRIDEIRLAKCWYSLKQDDGYMYVHYP